MDTRLHPLLTRIGYTGIYFGIYCAEGYFNVLEFSLKRQVPVPGFEPSTALVLAQRSIKYLAPPSTLFSDDIVTD